MIYQGLLFFVLLWIVYYVALPFLNYKIKSKKSKKSYRKKTFSESEQIEFDKELGILSKDDK
tara:strand:+ start:487 stop:672 length:186 start_codon:yes stop_codon:yes gene_type:complete